jgi:hypothetical protein
MLSLLLVGLGVLLIGWSAFLYEGEERAIADALASWWVKLDDTRQSAVRKNVVFMQHVAVTIAEWINGIFGTRLLSLRAVSASLCLSGSSALLVFFAANSARYPTYVDLSDSLTYLLPSAALFYVAVNNARYLTIVRPVVAACVIAIGMEIAYESETGSPTAMWEGFALGVVADYLIIIFTRRFAIRLMVVRNMAVPIVVAFGGILAAGLITAGPVYIASRTAGEALTIDAAWIAIATNLFGVIVSLAFVILPLTLLVHRLAWPVLNRSIYAIQRFQLFQQRKVLLFAGSTLICVGVPRLGPLVRAAAALFTR